MIVDPWGVVLAQAPDEGEGVIVADLDLARQDEIRAHAALAGQPPPRRLPTGREEAPV